jgi:hypothetical protein
VGIDDKWRDWFFTDLTPGDAERSMRRLALYTNPEQIRRQGLGLGRTRSHGEVPVTGLVRKVETLAERLAGTGIRYALEAFNPRRRAPGSGQIVRSAPELLEGAGTCLDFAVSLATLCVSEGIPVVLAYAAPDDPRLNCHAFVIVQETRDSPHSAPQGSAVYLRRSFADWVHAFDDDSGPVRNALVDATPLDESEAMDKRRARAMDWLREHSGQVHAVHVQLAVEEAGHWYEPPDGRDLGLTGWLPDLPADLADYPTRADLLHALDDVTGNVVIVGERGSGKSTLALQVALRRGKGHGWYLDGSDRGTLRRSLADAEARCRGHWLANDQSDTLTTLAAAARRRLANRDAPWVVVIDNADRPAEVVDDFPVPRAGQLLVLTTTDRSWVDGRTGGWRVVHLGRLRPDELDEDTRGLGLHDEELLPGLVRIARACSPGSLAATAEQPPGAARLVHAVLGSTGFTSTPTARAVVAASYMPAEQITVRWLAGALGLDPPAAAMAADQAQQLGLVEYGRFGWSRGHDETPLWMHRLVRGAVRTLADTDGHSIGLKVLHTHHAERRPQRYSEDELDELRDFLHTLRGEHPADVLAGATTAVINLLEPLSFTQRGHAAALAATVLPHVDTSDLDGLEMYCLALMARARKVSQDKKATVDEIEQAVAWCEQATAACGDTDDNEKRLLRGRADAMRGILLKRRAVKLRGADDEAHRRELEHVIEVLEQSYRTRRAALTVVDEHGNERLERDPDQHVDRGWFNLGGAYLDLANLLVDIAPHDVPDALSRGLRAYVGSLSLRRRHADARTVYTAASLWGTALVLYTAAVHCPGELGLDGLSEAPEIDPVIRRQNGRTLLRAAEECALQALQVRAQIDGPFGADTGKARDLLRKVSLAWLVLEKEREDYLAAIRDGLAPFLADLRFDWTDMAEDSR